MMMADWKSLTNNTRRVFRRETPQTVWRDSSGSGLDDGLQARHASSAIRRAGALAGYRLFSSPSGRADRIAFAELGPGFRPGGISHPRRIDQSFPFHCNRQRVWSEC